MRYRMPDSPESRKVIDLLTRLHQVMARDEDDSPEGEALRDELDEVMRTFTREEKEWARHVSENLYLKGVAESSKSSSRTDAEIDDSTSAEPDGESPPPAAHPDQ